MWLKKKIIFRVLNDAVLTIVNWILNVTVYRNIASTINAFETNLVFSSSKLKYVYVDDFPVANYLFSFQWMNKFQDLMTKQIDKEIIAVAFLNKNAHQNVTILFNHFRFICSKMKNKTWNQSEAVNMKHIIRICWNSTVKLLELYWI